MSEYDPWRAPPAPSAYGYANPYAAPDEPVPPPPIGPEGPTPFPYGAYWYAYGHGVPGAPPPRNGLGVAALVLGIVTAIGFVLWPLAIVTGVLAVIFGVVGRRRAGRGAATNGGQALGGLICGVGGLLSAVGVGIAVLA
ncbi:DUF4190 domain-containing protein [Streptomyces sp. NPDC002790]|uniref:DUF4190 domain-containing protein n=1 Tax=Streptomyces sp. NPDC002790 TaxID=3154431 RepID=UPI00331F5843